MKLFLILALCTLIGCKSTQPLTQPMGMSQDSIHVHQVQFDSIYIYKDRLILRERDTVYLKDTEVEYRYRLLRDTVCMVQRDSIPYPVTMVQTQEVKYIPWYIQTLSWMGAIAAVRFLYKRKMG